MNTLQAFAMGEANRHKELMVFDWDKAARLIKESGCEEAAAGLQSDWEWTGGNIFTDGKPNFDDDTYLASTWAVPQLEIYKGEWSKTVDCYKMQSETPGWGSDTKWPDSALAILGEGGAEK